MNLVFSLHSGQRYLQTHGAVSDLGGGNTGLVAGCGFAFHILRASLQPLPLGHGVTVRVYVDGITVSVVAPTAWGVVRALGFGLPKLRDALSRQGVVLSQPKEQFFSPTIDVLSLWNRVHPTYAGHKDKTAKDLGASQRAIGKKSTRRGTRIAEASNKAKRIRTLATGRKANVLITRASLQAGVSTRANLTRLHSENLPRSG